MPKTVRLRRLEEAYRSAIQSFEANRGNLTPDTLVRVSLQLFKDIRVKEIPADPPDADMLLFQYGTYNWGNEHGEHFSFDITRQLIKPNMDGDIFQLSWKLVYDPAPFAGIKASNGWSVDFATLEEWEVHVRTSPGYKAARAFAHRAAVLGLHLQ